MGSWENTFGPPNFPADIATTVGGDEWAARDTWLDCKDQRLPYVRRPHQDRHCEGILEEER